MKLRKRLTSKEAILLNLEVKENEYGRSSARYVIKEDDWELVLSKRINPEKESLLKP